ncbi:hypothetical protein I5I66_23475, partial [Pseudomonas aeruginosa]|nr:hypothetical protein [Pseudomonas aeruginosa]
MLVPCRDAGPGGPPRGGGGGPPRPAKASSYVSGRYAQVREQFNVPIAAFEGIQEALAR